MDRSAPPPRVLVVSQDQWPRALLRALLVEEGWDAIGARTLAEALGVPAEEPGRGPVACVVVDQSALEAPPAGGGSMQERTSTSPLAELRTRLGGPPVVLLARGTVPPPSGPWTEVVRRPASVDRVADAVRRVVAGE